MTLFDLLFILVFLTTVLGGLTALVQFLLRHRDRSKRTLRRVGLFAGIYWALVIVVSLVLPRDEIRIGEPRCFDDWCISADSVSIIPLHLNRQIRVTFTLSSRAKRVAQRELGVSVYLVDLQNNRYDPQPDPHAVPFDTLLAPAEIVVTDREFTVPAGAGQVGLVITHEGGIPIQWFILGEGPFRKPPIIPLLITFHS